MFGKRLKELRDERGYSMDKFVEISRLLGEMGFGRTVTGIFRLK